MKQLSDNELELLKQRNSIPDQWERNGLQGECHLGRNARSPFRDDGSKGSFYVAPDGTWFKDFGGDGNKGDVITFYGLCNGATDKAEAFKLFAEQNEGSGVVYTTPDPARFEKRNAAEVKRQKNRQKVRDELIPTLRKGTDAEIDALARNRSFDPAGLRIAQDMGYLRFGEFSGELKVRSHRKGKNRPAYFLRSLDDRLVQARRLDGREWRGLGKSFNIISEDGVTKDVMLGSELLPDPESHAVLLVEGTTDFLAAMEICYRITPKDGRQWIPLAAINAQQSIPDSDLESIDKRDVLIFGDAGDAGREAVSRWGSSLSAAGCHVEAICADDIDAPIKDLADCLTSFTTEAIDQLIISLISSLPGANQSQK